MTFKDNTTQREPCSVGYAISVRGNWYEALNLALNNWAEWPVPVLYSALVCSTIKISYQNE